MREEGRGEGAFKNARTLPLSRPLRGSTSPRGRGEVISQRVTRVTASTRPERSSIRTRSIPGPRRASPTTTQSPRL